MIERHWNADLLAKIFGAIFILVGIVGFIPNPLVSETGFDHIDPTRVTKVTSARQLYHFSTHNHGAY